PATDRQRSPQVQSAPRAQVLLQPPLAATGQLDGLDPAHALPPLFSHGRYVIARLLLIQQLARRQVWHARSPAFAAGNNLCRRQSRVPTFIISESASAARMHKPTVQFTIGGTTVR